MADPDVLYLAPARGDIVLVHLTDAMVRDLRAHDDALPSATNDLLADDIRALLDAGTTRLAGTCTRACGQERADGARVLGAYELVSVRCRQLGATVVFCAADCDLPRA